jgi:hypothetical protein
MPARTYWGNDEKTVIICEYSGKWTLEEMAKSSEEYHNLAKQIDHPFDVIVNAHNTHPPKAPLNQMKHGLITADPKQRYMVLVQASAFGKMMMNVLQKLGVPNTNQEQMLFADSLDEAYDLLKAKGEIETT